MPERNYGSGLRGLTEGFKSGFGMANDYFQQQRQNRIQDEKLERQKELHDQKNRMNRLKIERQELKQDLPAIKKAYAKMKMGVMPNETEQKVLKKHPKYDPTRILSDNSEQHLTQAMKAIKGEAGLRDPETIEAADYLLGPDIQKDEYGKQDLRKKLTNLLPGKKPGTVVAEVATQGEDGSEESREGMTPSRGDSDETVLQQPIDDIIKQVKGTQLLRSALDNEKSRQVVNQLGQVHGFWEDTQQGNYEIKKVYDEQGREQYMRVNPQTGAREKIGGPKGGEGGDPYGHLGEGIDAEKVTDFMEKRAARYFGERVGDKFSLGKNAEPVYNAFTRLGRQYVEQGQSLQEAADNAYADAVMANAPQAREQIRNQVMQNNKLTQADLKENPKAEQLVHQKVRERFHSQRDKFLKEAGIKQAGGRRRRAQQGSGQGGGGGAEWLDQYEVAGDPQKVRQYIAQKTKEAMENNQGMTQEKAMKWAAQSAALQGYLREKGQGGQKKQQSASQQKDQEPQVTHKGRGFEEDSWSPLMDTGRAIMGGLNTAAQGLSEKFDRTGELQKIVQDMEPGDSAPLVYQVVSKMYDPETGKWQPPEGEKWPSAQELKRAYPHLKGKALEVANQLLKKQGERRGLKGAQ